MSEKRSHEFVESDSEEEKGIFRKKAIWKVKDHDQRLIIVLEKANLETIKTKKDHELFNSEDHIRLLKKWESQGIGCRPDIVHQCLLMLFDSPLNRAGLLQVYIHTEKNALIEINPQTRIPRTFKRFAALMVQLLFKFKIRSSDGTHKLMQMIKNPITDHLPANCKKICMSFSAEKCLNPRKLVPQHDPIVIVVGAMAHGQVDVNYTDETVAISQYPLSAALTCSKLCSAFEEVWGIH
ncbi:ribosomal RNA small subunit methyltransferase NEP1 [Trichonephila inaurata madagascariensis]|uniref:18S rRNA (pseudouridine-N1)-methyltransferase n=1 Tax=Trichonephila inaurata madagascariensis TaxID=2747483 RepID=A0A8X7BUF9_9ARAC|nr:ribosomal RNA small subunit methyltransferase NEP1 [Trichonephila inaurata madagascariensis]